MARPARYKTRETGTDTVADAENGAGGAENEPLDGGGEEVQSARTGLVSEGELDLARKVATRLGWTPKEQWKRDPAKWVDADEFLDRTPAELDSYKDRLKRTGQAAEAAIEEARRAARIEAEGELRAAAKAGDEDAALRAGEKLAKTAGPPPQTVAWMGRNTWFNADPAAQAVAVSEVNRLAATGASIEEQLEAAEKQVRKRFPEHFEDGERGEVRLSESRRSPPAVREGSRAPQERRSGAAKEKGFDDIPAGDKALFNKHFAKRGIKPEAYAKTYWSNVG